MQRLLASILMILLLAACSTFQVGERYDKAIDDDLNKLQIASTTFVKLMIQDAGTPDGSFSSSAAKTYYASSAASLSNIIMRASLLADRECPINQGAQAADDLVERFAPGISDPPAASEPITGNCMVVALRPVQLWLETLEAEHEEFGEIDLTRGNRALRGIDRSILNALEGLRAKDYSRWMSTE